MRKKYIYIFLSENGKIEHTFKNQTWAIEKGKIGVYYHGNRSNIISKTNKQTKHAHTKSKQNLEIIFFTYVSYWISYFWGMMSFIKCRKILTIISLILYWLWNIIWIFRFLEVILEWGSQGPTLNLFMKTVGQESKNERPCRIGEHFSYGFLLSITLSPNPTLVLNIDLHFFYLVRLPVFLYICAYAQA